MGGDRVEAVRRSWRTGGEDDAVKTDLTGKRYNVILVYCYTSILYHRELADMRKATHAVGAAGARGGRTGRAAPGRPRAQGGGKAKRAKAPKQKRGAKRRQGGGIRKVAAEVGGLATWFPALRRQGGRGLAAMVAVVEGTGRGWDRSVVISDQARGARTAGAGAEAAVSRAAKAVASRVRQAELAAVLAALGSPHRLRIMLKLLEGAATYRALQKVAGLQAGPLYHHISHLRLAALIGPKQRDLYELTRAGRDVLLAALLLGPLARDRRRRPAPQE